MARKTKLKIAAFATTLVATAGFVALGPATASDSGRVSNNIVQRNVTCC